MSPDQTIYVVDDDAAVRASLKALLEAAGFTVEAYASGREALDGLNGKQSGCLLLDLRLPDMSGLDVQQALKALAQEVKIILVTGYADVPSAVNAMKSGAFDFIEKPYDDVELLKRVEDALLAQQKDHETVSRCAEARSRIERLTKREREVFHHLVKGQPNKVIAYELGISPRTVEIHRARVMEKLQARSLSEIVRLSITAGSDTIATEDEGRGTPE